MKKAIFTVLALVLVVSLWINIRNSAGIQISSRQGKIVAIKRGSLEVDIEATGIIDPKERVDIKSEAGGTVQKTPYEVGSMVKAGDLLIKLDPEDEQRRMETAGKRLKQAEINFEQSKLALYLREEVDVPRAKAQVNEVVADLELAEWRLKKAREFQEKGIADEDEWRQPKAAFERLKARKQVLEAELERSKKNIEVANLDLEQSELAVARARDDLADARERLDETEIVAPFDGMLVQLLTKKGSVISSASQSFTGGTLLAKMADVTELYVLAEVDEADIGRVREVAPAHARPGHRTDSGGFSSGEIAEAHVGPDPRTGDEIELPSQGEAFPQINLATPVTVEVESFPSEVFSGVIEVIEPEAKKIGQVVTYIVRIRLTSKNVDKLFLGMQATVKFVAESVEDVVLVPNEAVRYFDGKRGVYIPVDSETEPGKKRPQFKAVKLGLDNGAFSEVIEGLAEGDEVYSRLPRNREGEEDLGED